MSNIKKKKGKMHNLFWNDRFLIVFSIIVAVIFWAAVCVSFSPETTSTIENVPVKINLENSVPSQCNLQVFGDESFTVDITVSGSRYVIGENLLSADDFNVTAMLSSVTTAGNHSLQIKVSKTDEEKNFTIESVSESFITVYFDELATESAVITPVVNRNDFVKDGYITDDNYIMDTKSVEVSGPALEIAQLYSVEADIQIDKKAELSSTTTYEAELSAYSKNHEKLNYIKFYNNNSEEIKSVNVGIPIYQESKRDFTVDFANVPVNYIKNLDKFISYDISPSNMDVSVLQNGGNDEDSISVGTIDFSQIKSGDNKFVFPLDSVKNLRKDEVKGKQATVKFKLDDLGSKSVVTPLGNVSVINSPDNKKIIIKDSFITAQIYGNKTEIEKIDSDNIQAKIDFSKNISDDDNVYIGPVYLKDSDDCWIYGNYTLNYSFSK